MFKKNQKYLAWKKTLNLKKIKILKIKETFDINRKNCDFNISAIDCKLLLKNKIVKRFVQLEGDSVVIIPILIVKELSKPKTIVVEQFRLPVGDCTLEFPSGGVSNQKFKRQAAKELFEETGLRISEKKLKNLNKKPIYMLPANNFARVHFYYFIKKINLDFIKKNNNCIKGDYKNGEFIKIKIVDFDQLKKFTTASVIIGLKLLRDLKIFDDKSI